MFSLKVVHVLDRQPLELRKEAYMYARKLVTDPDGWTTALPSPPYEPGLRAVEFYIELRVDRHTSETVLVRLIVSIERPAQQVHVLLVEFE